MVFGPASNLTFNEEVQKEGDVKTILTPQGSISIPQQTIKGLASDSAGITKMDNAKLVFDENKWFVKCDMTVTTPNGTKTEIKGLQLPLVNNEPWRYTGEESLSKNKFGPGWNAYFVVDGDRATKEFKFESVNGAKISKDDESRDYRNMQRTVRDALEFASLGMYSRGKERAWSASEDLSFSVPVSDKMVNKTKTQEKTSMNSETISLGMEKPGVKDKVIENMSTKGIINESDMRKIKESGFVGISVTTKLNGNHYLEITSKNVNIERQLTNKEFGALKKIADELAEPKQQKAAVGGQK